MEQELRQTNAKLQQIRTPPTETITTERNRILDLASKNLLLIQIELAILVICLVLALLLPSTAAKGATVLLVSVGIAIGIFLRK